MHQDQDLPKEGVIKQYSAKETPTDPTPLPKGFVWANFDPNNEQECEEICGFVMDHYVESDSGDFRLQYTTDKFRWATLSPGYIAELLFCVRNSDNN